MERLTERSKNSDMVWFKDTESEGMRLEPCEMTAHHSRMTIEKLAAYEDAEEQGLLLRLPAPLDGVERFSLDNGKTTWQRVYEADMPEEGTAMNENEAIEVLKDFDKQVTAKADGAYQSTVGKMACDTAIKALEEVQQYRAIGTPEQCRAAMEKQTETLTVDKAKTIAAKAICIGCGYLADCKCDYNGGNCMISKPMLESVLKSFDDWSRRENDGKID